MWTELLESDKAITSIFELTPKLEALWSGHPINVQHLKRILTNYC